MGLINKSVLNFFNDRQDIKKLKQHYYNDHTTDEMTKEYFNKVQSKNIECLSSDEKTKMQLDESLFNEIDLKTFKTGIDVILILTRRDETSATYKTVVIFSIKW